MAVLTGLDLLERERFKKLRGKSVALVTNHTAITRDKKHIIELFLEHSIDLKKIFSPEHGLTGMVQAGNKVTDQKYKKTRIPVHSLYGERFKPDKKLLQGIDLLIFDMQDVGARFFTYSSTLYLCMQACAESDLPLLILDRPNPIGGTIVEGPLLDPHVGSLVGKMPVPLRHGMTIGELALFANKDIKCQLDVITMKKWKRSMLFNETKLPWIAPSPNMVSPQAALLYPGIALLESVNVSEGRGTAAPFQQIGAPWIDKKALALRLTLMHLPGVSFLPCTFTPRPIAKKALSPKHKGKLCSGVKCVVTDPHELRSFLLGITILSVLNELYSRRLNINHDWLSKLSGSALCSHGLQMGYAPKRIVDLCAADVALFKKARSRFLQY